MAGDNASFRVIASGTEPLSYQWQFWSTNLPGAMSPTLVISNANSGHSGPYRAVVSNSEGSTTSITAQLTVRAPGTSIYLPPPGGWSYRYEGTAMAPADTAALDGTWNHNNGSDAWAGDLRGAGDPPLGGLSVSNGILTMEDVMASGSGLDNRRFYFTHPLSQDPLTNANTILNDGVTFTFRARLTPPEDPLVELTNAPNGLINVADGKGMIGMRQAGSSGMIVSFSLNMAAEDTNATTLYDFPAAGLHMNNLNGNSRGPNVDPGEAGTVNVFPLNPAEFHEFWITVQDNGVDAGTHRVSVYVDGSTNATIFNVTAGIGADTPITNYLAVGLPSAFQRGAFDLDWVGYKQGVHIPAEANVPVTIATHPASQVVNEGETATFNVVADGTPPVSFQWFRDGAVIPGANGPSYTTGALLPADSGAVFTVECENVGGSAISDPATLTVVADGVPPTVVSAAGLNGQTIGVCFSERVTAATAQDPGNYTVNNGVVSVTSATLRPNGTTVLLAVTGLGSQVNTTFTVRATNIVDVSFAGNSGGGIAQGVVHGLNAVNVGTANGSTFTCASNRFELEAGGGGLGGTADVFHFTSMARTGDFDVRVRVSGLNATNTLVQAGLVARVDQTPGSPTVNAFVTPPPGDNGYHATYRATVGGGTAAWPEGAEKSGVPFPNAWIRLTRAGDTFTAYHGTNGTGWEPYAQLTEVFPGTMLVGIAGANLAESAFDELIYIPPPEIVTQPVSVVATNGDPVTFSVVATSPAELRYQWRFNGTDLPGETNATLNFGAVQPNQAGTYQVRVANGGGALLSAEVTLTVRALDYGDASATYPTLLANDGARHVLVPGIQLGLSADFELNAFAAANATGDDANGIDDEDGVTFMSPLWVDQTATIEVVTSTNGVLNAWIDFGADGNWAQVADHVFVDYALEAGTNLLSLIVPSDAIGANTFARFRFSTFGGLGPGGIASDGEVEDYAVEVIPVADLSIAAEAAPEPIAAGSNLTYQVTIGNIGPAVANGVVVTNSFGGSVQFVSANSTQGSCANNGGLINCSIGDLAIGNSATITLLVKPLQSGTLTGTFGIHADQPDPNTGDNSAVTTSTVDLAPTIVAPPSSLVVTQHNAATFAVTANGTPPLFYQWFHEGSPLADGTNAMLVINDAQSLNAGSYYVRITNHVGGTLSAPVTLTVLYPPVITEQPQSRTNLAGSTATFVVVAEGTPPLQFQWLAGGEAISGETNASLVLANVQKTQAGVYSVRVMNAAGTIESTGAVLTVIEMDFGDAPAPFPTMLADDGARHRVVAGLYLGASTDFEPDGQTSDGSDEDGVGLPSAFLLGQSARLEVTASGAGMLNAWVDWNANGSWADAGERIFSDQLLADGTNVLNVTVPADAELGSRAARFRFSTAAGLSFTGEAVDGEVEDYVLNVQPAIDLSVSVGASPATARFGSNVTYIIGITNGGPSAATAVVVTSSLPASVTILTLPGSCSAVDGVIGCNMGSLGVGSFTTLEIITRPNEPGAFTNAVSVSAGEQDLAPSNNAAQVVVSVLEFPAISLHPQSATVVSGEAANFQVSATGTALGYQWTFNGVDIPGATAATFARSPALPDHEGTYRVRVSNALGEVLSDPAQLTVLVPPVIMNQPGSVTVSAGESASFSVTASGTEPLSYQWTFEGTDLTGRASATLTLENVSATNEGAYRVRVSNDAGFVVSDSATLTVLVGVNIIQHPQSQTVFASASASLEAVATGTQPISYRWFYNGTNLLTGETNATLVLSNVQVTQSGEYTAVVSNRVSAMTSAVAQITVREADFGDAAGPSYATLLVFNGAYHFITPGVYLGSGVDFEADGQPAVGANGDDAAGQDDEDGVVFVTPLLLGQPGRVNVTASTNGLLDAWIDFNGNGDWTDVGEQVFVARPLTTGNNSLQFSIPASAIPHGALSRFRFSTAGALSFSGGADDGEVEDHVATLEPAMDLSVTLVDQPDPVLVGSNLNLIVTISNAGPSTANGVVLSQYVPSSAAFVSANLSQGSCSIQAGVITCDIGAIPQQQTITGTVRVVPQGIGLAVHRAEVTSTEEDVNSTNNTAVQITTAVAGVGPFRNSNSILINDFGPASIYPSTITVSGVTGTVHQVLVTLHNFSHLYPDDLDLLLVGPRGQRVVLMSDAGGGNDPAYVTFSFDDSSDLVLPDEDLIIDEPYRPSNYNGGDPDVFNAPAPAGPYTNRLAAFRGSDANGAWSLYIMDDFAQDSGELLGGWSLDFLVLDPIADASVSISATPSPAAAGQNVTYSVSVTNGGPSASQISLTNVLPVNAMLQSFTPSQGNCTNAGGQIVCDFGLMESRGTASLTFVVVAPQTGVLSNYARVAVSHLDLDQTNNVAVLLTPVMNFADVSLSIVDSTDPAPVGEDMTYTLVVSNLGPHLADALVLTNQLPAGFALLSVSSSLGTCANQGGIVSCDLGNLAAGNFATIQITGQATTVGRMTNSALVQGNNVDGNLANNQRNEQTVVVFRPPAFINASGITVPNPYPSTIQVSGLTGAVYNVSIIISNLTHSAPESIQALLVGPSGQNVLLMNAVGGSMAVANVTLRLDDQAAVPLPDDALLSSGTYRPASYSAATSLPAPAPPAPYSVALTTFRGTDANGTWSLFTQGGGSIGAWALEISTLEPIADVRVAVASQPPAVSVGSNLTYVITVSNRGPAVATGIVLSNLLPANVLVTSATGCTNICNLGSLNPGSQLQFLVHGVALAEGFATNVISAFAAERDLDVTNNVAMALTLMKMPPIISGQPQNLTVTNGDSATFTVGVTGAGPFAYQWLHNGAPVSGETNATLVIPNVQQVNAGNYAVRVSDGVGSPLSATARLTVLNRPTISDIPDMTIPEDSGSDLPFVIGDLESIALALEVTSSNPLLIPIGNVTISGSGDSRTASVRPVTNQFGVATITITVRDEDGITASDSFILTVTSENDPPVLGATADQIIDEDRQQSFALQASDVEDAPAQLLLAAASDDTNLLAVTVLDRTLTLSGLLNQFGAARVTVVLTDSAGAVVSNSFGVLVNPVNDQPTLDPISAVAVEQRAGLTVLPLSGISSGAANEPQMLSVAATTANTNLVGALNVNYVSGSSGFLSFETVSNYTGTTTVTVTVDDGAASNNVITRTFAVSIGDTNDPPVISAILDQVIAEDASLQIDFTVSDEETAANALLVAAVSSNTNLVRDSSLLLSGTDGNRTLPLTPEPNVSGVSFITISVTDAHDLTVTRSFQLQVSAVNDPPAFEVVPVLTVAENSPAQVVPLRNISAGAPDEPHNLVITATSSQPSLIPDPIVSYSNPNTNGTITLMPQPDRTGTAVITIVVNDRGASNNVAVRTLTVTVTDQNNPPVISRIFNQTTPEDTVIDIPFSVADAESSPESLVLTAVSANTSLVPNDSLVITSIGANRSLSVVPAQNAYGTAEITISATDTNGASSTVTFVLEVSAVNDPPTISDIPDQQINEDGAFGPFPFNVNDLETAASSLNVSAVSGNPALVPQSRIAVTGSGTNRWIRIIPAQNRAGSAAITVTVRDADGGTTSDTFVLNVQATNDPPVISVIGTQTIMVGMSNAIPFTINDQETDPAALSLAASSSNLSVLPMTNIVLGGSAANRSILLRSLPNVTGTSTVSIVVMDDEGASNWVSFVVQVTAGSGAPVVITQPEDQTAYIGGTATFSVAATGAPVLRYRWRLNGTNLPNATNFTLVITNVKTSDAGLYTVGIGNSIASITSAVAVLTVATPGATTPALGNIPDQSTPEDVPLTLNLALQDADTPAHFLTLSAVSTNETLVPPGNYRFEGSGSSRTLTILPAPNEFGTNLITLIVSDGLLSSSKTFVLRVTPVNDPPTFDRISNVSAVANTVVTVPLTGIGPGAANETTAVNITAVHNNSAVLTNLTVNYTPGASSGSLSVTIRSNATGSATITATAVDGGPATLRTFQILIRSATNQNPIIAGLTNVITTEDNSTGPLPFTVSDPDGSANQITITAFSGNTNVIVPARILLGGSGADRTITLNPNTNQHGTSLISVTVSDPGFGISTTNFLLTVEPLNDLPAISSIPSQSLDEDNRSSPIPVFVRDIETPPSELLLSASSSNPSLIPNTNLVFGGSGSNRVLVLQAVNAQSGSAVITVSLEDADGGSTSTNFNVFVNLVNDTPAISAVSNITVSVDTSTGPVPFTVWDEETAASLLSVSAMASDSTLVPPGSISLTGTSSNRTISIQPAVGRTGASTITISASDGNSVGSQSFVLKVVTDATNRAPTLDVIPDIVINEDASATTIDLTGISRGAAESGQPVAIAAISDNRDLIPDPIVTYTSPNSTGSLTLLPSPGTNGLAQITVTVNNGTTTFSRAFNLTVRARPQMSAIADLTISEDVSSPAIPFDVSDVETPASNLVFTVISSNPSVLPVESVVVHGTETNRTLTVTGAPDQFGHSVVTVTVTDLDGLSRSNTFVVIVTPVNDQPTLDPISALTIFEDQGPTTVPLNRISSGAVNEQQLLMLHVTSGDPAMVPAPTISYTSLDANGSLTITPVPNAHGTATITVILNDGQSTNQFASRTFDVTVNEVDDPPTLNAIPDLVIEHDAGPEDVVLTGIGPGDPNEAQIVTVEAASSNPVVISNLTIAYTYPSSMAVLTLRRNPGVSGTATITVTVSDGPNSLSQTFLATVRQPPSGLAVGAIPSQTIPEDSVAGPIAFTINDDGQPSVELSAVSSNPGLISPARITFDGSGTNRTILLAPETNQFGNSIITVIARAGDLTASNAFQITVTPVDDFPFFILPVPDLVMDEDTTLEVPVIVGDPETSGPTLLIAAESHNLSVFPSGRYDWFWRGGETWSVRFRPPANVHGTAEFHVRVRDSAFQRTTNFFTVTVRSVNDLPIISPILDQTILEDHQVEVGFFVDDVETPVSDLTVAATSSNTNLIPNASFQHVNNGQMRLLRVTPTQNLSGSNIVISVIVTDGDGATANASFSLNVLPDNDPPTITQIADASTNVGESTAALPFIIGDVETAASQLVLFARSSNTNLAPAAGIELSGLDSNRTVRVTPTPGQTGLAAITVEVSDGDGGFTETTFELTVNDTNGPPVIVLDPQGQTVNAGAEVTFRVVATGPGPMQYVWQKDGEDMNGRTNAILTLDPVQRSDRGFYRATVSNANGAAMSAPATLEVFDPARILSLARNAETVQIVAESAVGQRYALEYRDSLASGSWTVLTTLDGTGTPITFTDSAATGSARFYRLRIE